MVFRNQMTGSGLTIRARLMAIMLFALVPAAVIVLWIGYQQRERNIADIQKEILAEVDHILDLQKSISLRSEQLLTLASEITEVRNLDIEGCARVFPRMLERNPDYTTLLLTDTHGQVLAMGSTNTPLFSVGDRPYFTNALAQERMTVGGFVISRTAHVPALNYGMPVPGEEGRPAGLLVTGFRLSAYDRILANHHLPPRSMISLFDAQGVCLYNARPGAVDSGTARSLKPGELLAPDWLQAFRQQSRGIFEEADESGERFYFGFGRLSLRRGEPPYVFARVKVPVVDAKQLADRELRRHMTWLAAVFVLALGLAWYVGETYLVRRISGLAESAREWKRGNWKAKPTSQQGPQDEVAQLVHVFEDMASGIQLREEAYRASEGRLRTLVENMPVIVYAADPLGVFVLWNREAERITGFQGAEIVGNPQAMELLYPDVDYRERLRVEMGNRGDDYRDWESLVTCKDLRIRTIAWSNISNQVPIPGWARWGIGVDVTERRNAERAAIESWQFVLSILDALSSNLCVLDEQGRIIASNKSWRAFHSGGSLAIRESGEAINYLQACEDSAKSGHAEAAELAAGIRAVMCGERESFSLEYPTETIRGKHWFLVRVTRFATADSVRVVVSNEDITRLKVVEEQLRQSQKLEAIGQLAGGVAHDFNNILAAMLLRLSLLQTEPLAEPIRESLSELEKESRRAANLTRQLLAFGRRQVLQRKPLELNQVLSDMVGMLRRLLGERVNLEFEPAAELPRVVADVSMVEQVVMNLTVNARDAIPGGGTVRIGTLAVELSEAAIAGNPERRAGHYVCILVEDTGAGMDAETQKHLFEPFFTTKALGKGTGLGLATVYGIVKQHQGWIEVESEVGRGTTFLVYLPAEPEPSQAVQRPVKPATVSRGRETILVVEDEPSVRQMLRACLERQGYLVFEASNGQEALAVWKERKDQIDLLFADMVMPGGIEGLDLARQFGQVKPSLKVVISSGYSLELSELGGIPIPGVVFLPKPYEIQAVAETVRNCLDGKRPPPPP